MHRAWILSLILMCAILVVGGLLLTRGGEVTPQPALPAGANRLELIIDARSATPNDYTLTTSGGDRLVARANRRGRIVLYGVPPGPLTVTSVAGGRARVMVPPAGGIIPVRLCARSCP